MQTIGERLRWLRERIGVPCDKIDELLGMTRGQDEHYEKGRRSPSADTVVKLAEIFGVTTDWILRGEGKEPKTLRVNEAVRAYAAANGIDLAAPARFQREDG